MFNMCILFNTNILTHHGRMVSGYLVIFIFHKLNQLGGCWAGTLCNHQHDGKDNSPKGIVTRAGKCKTVYAGLREGPFNRFDQSSTSPEASRFAMRFCHEGTSGSAEALSRLCRSSGW